jgi:hypothetical protein
MTKHRQCPHAKRHGDRNLKYHEEQHKDVARILAAHPPKNVEKEHTYGDDEMRHTYIIVRTQITRVGITHSREATNCHYNYLAINQLRYHRRQPAPILHNEGIVIMDRLNRRRAKQSGSAGVRIEFVMLCSQCQTAREWETSTYTKNIGVRASTCNRCIAHNMTVWSHKV